MAGFNFGKIRPILNKYFNTASFDIGRRVKYQLPTGVWREELIDPYIVDLPCHISFNTTDNPDPASIDTKPIIVSATIYCDLITDLRNGDLLTVRQLDNAGETLETYKGTIGEPQTIQSRKSAIMAIRSAV